MVDLRDWPCRSTPRSAAQDARGQYSTRWRQVGAKVRRPTVISSSRRVQHGYPAVLENALDYCYDE